MSTSPRTKVNTTSPSDSTPGSVKQLGVHAYFPACAYDDDEHKRARRLLYRVWPLGVLGSALAIMMSAGGCGRAPEQSNLPEGSGAAKAKVAQQLALTAEVRDHLDALDETLVPISAVANDLPGVWGEGGVEPIRDLVRNLTDLPRELTKPLRSNLLIIRANDRFSVSATAKLPETLAKNGCADVGLRLSGSFQRETAEDNPETFNWSNVKKWESGLSASLCGDGEWIEFARLGRLGSKRSIRWVSTGFDRLAKKLESPLNRIFEKFDESLDECTFDRDLAGVDAVYSMHCGAIVMHSRDGTLQVDRLDLDRRKSGITGHLEAEVQVPTPGNPSAIKRYRVSAELVPGKKPKLSVVKI